MSSFFLKNISIQSYFASHPFLKIFISQKDIFSITFLGIITGLNFNDVALLLIKYSSVTYKYGLEKYIRTLKFEKTLGDYTLAGYSYDNKSISFCINEL